MVDGTSPASSAAGFTVSLELTEVYGDACYDLFAFARAMADAPTNHKGARDAYM